MKKEVYMCQRCCAFYEDMQRAKACHYGFIVAYVVEMFERVSCSKAFKHLFTNKKTGKRIAYCYYCKKMKGVVKKQYLKR